MRVEDPAANSIKWLGNEGTGDDSPRKSPPAGSQGSAPHVVRPRIVRRFGMAVVALCAVGVVGLGVFAVASHERVESPLAAPRALPMSTPDPVAADRFQTALGTLPELTMILSQFGGQPAIRINSGTNAMTDTAAYGELHSFAVDVSGRWLAALSGNAAVGGAQLWFGPADGDLGVAATDVRGFAWHDSVPASLAYGAVVDQGDGFVVTIDVAAAEFEPELLFATPHHVEHWGDWGFVVRPVLTDQGFHVLSPTGAEIATGYRGSVAGVVDNRLVVNVAGGRQSPLLIFPADGRAWPIFTLTDTQIVQSIATGGAGGAVALQVSHFETEVHEIRIFPATGEPPTRVRTAAATGAMTWSTDGSTLFFLRQGANQVTELVEFDLATGSLVATPIGASPTTNHATSTIAIG